MACHTSVGGTRLIGPLIAMNNKGIIASRMIEDYEMEEISSKTGLKVTRLESRFTAVGNLVAANDHGAIVSPVLEHHAVEQVKATLGTETLAMTIGEYTQVGAMVVATNSGAAVSPKAGEQEAEEIGKDPEGRGLRFLGERGDTISRLGGGGQLEERRRRLCDHGAGARSSSPVRSTSRLSVPSEALYS